MKKYNLAKRLLSELQLQDLLIPHFKLKPPLDSFSYELHTLLEKPRKKKEHRIYKVLNAGKALHPE